MNTHHEPEPSNPHQDSASIYFKKEPKSEKNGLGKYMRVSYTLLQDLKDPLHVFLRDSGAQDFQESCVDLQQ